MFKDLRRYITYMRTYETTMRLAISYAEDRIFTDYLV